MRETVKLCHAQLWRLAFLIALIVAAIGCFGPDPRDLEGAIAKAADAVAEGDKRELFKVIDQRARHALISIVGDRREAADLIRRFYPASEKTTALSALGDAVQAKDAAELFAMRCDERCMAGLAETLGAPREVRADGEQVHVRTTRGGEHDMYHGRDTWYGIVWHTQALFRERDRAAAELEQVRKNAELYQRQRALE